MNNVISSDDFVTVLNDAFSSGHDFSFNPTGVSMQPMLNGTTDTVVLTKKPQKLSKYDVVFFRRNKDNAIVLHRIVKVVDDSTYLLSGDSQYHFETVCYDDVFAVLKSFTHNGKTISTDSFGYKVYSCIILAKKYTRIFLSKMYRKFFK